MPSEQEMNSMLSAYGVSPSSLNFSWPNLIGGFIFGIIGWYAFNHGRKEKNYKALVVGVVLMVYPYFIPNTILLYVLGVGITSLLYFWRD
jgi:hypothetical protein